MHSLDPLNHYKFRIWLKQAGLEGRKFSHYQDEHNDVNTNLSTKDCTPSPRLPFTKDYRSKVLEHSKRHGLKEASEKFGVSLKDLKLWTRRAGKKFTRDIPDEFKRNIVEWGVKINSWKLAAIRYDVYPSTVGLWARKFNLKLRPGGMETYHDAIESEFEEAKKENTTGRTEPMPRLNQQTIIREENSKPEFCEYFDKIPGESEINNFSCVKNNPNKKIKKEVWKVRQQKPFVWQPVIDEITAESFNVPSMSEVDGPCILDNPVQISDERRNNSIINSIPEVNAGFEFCDSCQQRLDVGESLIEHFAIYHIA